MSEDDPGASARRSELTAEEVVRTLGGAIPRVSASQRPPPDMPPLTVMVLDGLADSPETIYSMRNCGETEPNGVALVGETYLLDALRSLLAEGLVEVDCEHVIAEGRIDVRKPEGGPPVADADLRRYSFRLSEAGEDTLKAAAGVLDAYWAAHPLTPARR